MMKRIFIIKVIFLIAISGFSLYASDNILTKVYSSDAEKIIHKAMEDSSSWERLAYMCDTFGPRLTGSEGLEKSLQWILQELEKDGFANIKYDTVYAPHWVRGKESCTLLEPRTADIPMLGLGGSIGTPPEGITAPVIVVKDFDEMERRSSEIKGKILIYNTEFKDYGQAVQYRYRGAYRAAEHGAVASLCRSVSPMSMRVPHTGSMTYVDSLPKIPHAAISAEDAMLLQRLHDRGQKPVVNIKMEAKTLEDVPTANIIAEIPGTERADEIIAAGGHIDSWDVGTGAQDDASGCIAVWEAIKLIKDLGLKPKRTLRLVFWANEENGVVGGAEYARMHKDEKHVLMFEFDSGVFPPSQLRYTGPDSLFLSGLEPVLSKIGDIEFTGRGGGVDIRPMMQLGVPGMSLNTDDKGEYFWYHHSPKDTPDKIDPKDLNSCIAAIAVALYIYADWKDDLPSKNEKEESENAKK